MIQAIHSIVRNRLAAVALAAASACATPAPRTADSAPADSAEIRLPEPAPSASDQAWDKAIVDQLDRDARRLANADGCADAGTCRVAPLGVKACGGPRGYVTYCATATDSVALFRKLEELARAERAYNKKYGIMSTCEFRLEPDVALVGRSCRATR